MSDGNDVRNKMRYVSLMRPLFRKRAVFSDETKEYRIPACPKAGEDVVIRLRTLKNNVDAVYFISGTRREPMSFAFDRGSFDFYEVRIPVREETIRYYFELQVEGHSLYYNKIGVTRDLSDRNSFRITPGFSTPAWSHGAVMYQIYTDRFRNGDSSNDVVSGEYCYLGEPVNKQNDWNSPPSEMDVRNFYGGDLAGIIEKLDYLQDLGIDVIYLNPIFVSPSNHKYDIQDYDHVDPHFGKIVKDEGECLTAEDRDNRHATRFICRVTNKANLEASDALLARLSSEIHKRGMRLILDGVFNHCGSFNKWLDRERIYERQPGYEKGAYVSKKSPYHSFFKFNNEHAWPYNEFYEGWWGHATLPKLNYEESSELFQYIIEVGKKWTSPPYSVDGWRLDVAADLGHSVEYNHHFWKEFRKAVKSVNPEAIVLAEHYGDAGDWLLGDQWDTVMNYDAFMEPVSWFLTGMEKHSDEYREELLGNGEAFENAMRYHMASFMGPSLLSAMNELDNHDHSRFLTRTNQMVGRVGYLGSEAAGRGIRPYILREAVVIQMTFIGAPTLYYGDEAGVVGFTDPDNRRTYPWGNEDQELLDFYKKAIALHKSSEVFREGSIKSLGVGYQTISYGRFNAREQFVVAVNAGEDPIPVEIPVWETGITQNSNVYMEEVLVTDREGYSAVPRKRLVTGGILTLDLRPFEAVVLHYEEKTLSEG
ncbi:MAG: glycoside hydrolase family 13 protein [Lachnospiraceae bacterium]|nr:glycoside hydrolase family 13 protein [Lachnospiraceae bacterium]